VTPVAVQERKPKNPLARTYPQLGRSCDFESALECDPRGRRAQGAAAGRSAVNAGKRHNLVRLRGRAKTAATVASASPVVTGRSLRMRFRSNLPRIGLRVEY